MVKKTGVAARFRQHWFAPRSAARSGPALVVNEASKPAAMVDWYDPRQLIATAVRVAISTIFGEYADRRDAMAGSRVAAPASAPRDYDYADSDVWLDYVADTGDGWNPTHAIARLLSAECLAPRGGGAPLPRARVLILGGDQVYPTASRDEYRTRLLGPFNAAAEGMWNESGRPDLYALPGNHDWYDGLNSFMGLFCGARDGSNGLAGGRVICGRQTRQTRSYFALRLPGNVWLWGVDLQLSAYVDQGQIAYFQHAAARWMQPESRVILCSGDPAWVYARTDDHKIDALSHFKNFTLIEKLVEAAGHSLCLVLTGDSHHYARYVEAGRNYITCGGGGAFLHPTHHLPARVDVQVESDTRSFSLARDEATQTESLFPSRAESRALSWRNLGFAWTNRAFTATLAMACMIFAWLLAANARLLDTTLSGSLVEGLGGGVLSGLGTYLTVSAASPGPLLVAVAAFVGHYYFAEFRPGLQALGVALAHGGAHAVANALCILLLAPLTAGLPAADAWLVVLGGSLAALVSGTLFGVYLLVCLNGFGRHWNEAFSSIRVQGFKSFLRIHVASDGRITVFPIGLRRVPDTVGLARPDQEALQPHLIERAIII